eukprot:COSAG02_NODE_45246_length_359_cov_0.588462_1_plen_58_part_01
MTWVSAEPSLTVQLTRQVICRSYPHHALLTVWPSGLRADRECDFSSGAYSLEFGWLHA